MILWRNKVIPKISSNTQLSALEPMRIEGSRDDHNGVVIGPSVRAFTLSNINI